MQIDTTWDDVVGSLREIHDFACEYRQTSGVPIRHTMTYQQISVSLQGDQIKIKCYNRSGAVFAVEGKLYSICAEVDHVFSIITVTIEGGALEFVSEL